MLVAVLLIMQMVFSGVIAWCVYTQMKSTSPKQAKKARTYSKEHDKLLQMRKIALNTPLNEAIRPKRFTDIIGQEQGLNALTAILCSPNPQHIIIYGPPGTGKTCAARVALAEAKKCGSAPFLPDAPFVEVDATTVRFDERAIADPLIGSVHDPIYQGAGALGVAGVPQPKPGAVTRAHGGVLFIDEIGELHPIQMNKLLKVLEDRRVMLDSAYYSSEDTDTPAYIHDVFKNGLPADFRLIGATTRGPESIPPAIRSRCMEIYFKPLESEHMRVIARNAAKRAQFSIEDAALDMICVYSHGGRDAANLVQVAAGFALTKMRYRITENDVRMVIKSGNYSPRYDRRIRESDSAGCICGLAVAGPGTGMILWIQAVVTPGDGQITVTGIVEREEVSGGQRRSSRRSQADCSVQNVKTALARLGFTLGRQNLHIDFPGGVPVDGPSAGIAMALACVSALTGTPIKRTIAVTGELSVMGEALPVGGIPEKVEAAKRAGAEAVLVPAANINDAGDIGGIDIIAYSSLQQAIALALKTDEIASSLEIVKGGVAAQPSVQVVSGSPGGVN